jgi:hypothetical protein
MSSNNSLFTVRVAQPSRRARRKRRTGTVSRPSSFVAVFQPPMATNTSFGLVGTGLALRPSVRLATRLHRRHNDAGSTVPPRRAGRQPTLHSFGFADSVIPLWVTVLLALFVGLFGPLLAPVAQQDQPHHYERHDIVIIDSKDGRHTAAWKRVDD